MKSSLTCEQLLAVPPILWGVMLLSILTMGSLGFLFRGVARGDGSLFPFLLPLFAFLSLVGLVFIGWLRIQLRDRGIFPRVLDARDRLGGEGDTGEALLQLRLTIQVLGWALSDLVGFFGSILSLISGEGAFAIGFGGAAVLALVALFPRRGEAIDQVTRWRTALSDKSFVKSTG